MTDTDDDRDLRPAATKAAGRRSMSAQQRAIALLARREHSQKELRQKLLQRGHSTEEIDAALQRLAETGLQCEERYAQSLARTRVGAGHGPRRIRNDLRQQGFGEEGIEAAMSASSQDWPSLAVEALQRRFGQASGSQDAMDRNSVMKLRSRQLAFLLRRGFDAETARIAQSRWERGD